MHPRDALGSGCALEIKAEGMGELAWEGKAEWKEKKSGDGGLRKAQRGQPRRNLTGRREAGTVGFLETREKVREELLGER